MLWPFPPSGSCMLMQSWCWYFQKMQGSVVEKAKWLWAEFTEEIFVMWSEGGSLILFILINLSRSVCSRPRMSSRDMKVYHQEIWKFSIWMKSLCAGGISQCWTCFRLWVQAGALAILNREGDAEFVLLLLKPKFVPKLNLWPASVQVTSWCCGWCTQVIPCEFSMGSWPYQHPTTVGISCPFRQ